VTATIEPGESTRVGRSPFRIRFDECGPDGLVRTSVLLRYAQDLASYHSALVGIDRAWYAERGIGWLVRAAEVAVLRPMRPGDELLGATMAAGYRRVWARRRSEFLDATGDLVAWCNIDWVLLDARGRPTRIPPEFDVAFAAPPAAFDLARVALTPAPPSAYRATFTVRPQELDPMDHANNAVYADWLDEAIVGAGAEAAIRGIPRLIRLEYARAAERGAIVVATAWPDDGPATSGWSVRIADEIGDLLRARLEGAGAGTYGAATRLDA
jgi:medium-chain acyl-[acyl-carrier-protein] hydrolase